MRVFILPLTSKVRERERWGWRGMREGEKTNTCVYADTHARARTHTYTQLSIPWTNCLIFLQFLLSSSVRGKAEVFFLKLYYLMILSFMSVLNLNATF